PPRRAGCAAGKLFCKRRRAEKRVSFLKFSTRSRPAARQWLRDRGSTGGDRPFGGGQAEPFSGRRTSKNGSLWLSFFLAGTVRSKSTFSAPPFQAARAACRCFPGSEHL